MPFTSSNSAPMAPIPATIETDQQFVDGIATATYEHLYRRCQSVLDEGMERSESQNFLALASILSDAMGTLQKKGVRAVADLQTQSNRDSRLCQLPDHHLVYVLSLSAAAVDTPISWLIKLESVCRHLRAVIKSNPTLWAHITESTPHHHIPPALLRSGEAPLYIGYRDPEVGPYDAYRHVSGLEHLVACASRWKEISITMDRRGLYRLFGLPTALPRLEVFQLMVREPPNESFQWSFEWQDVPTFLHEAPRLRVIHLSGVEISMPVAVLTALEEFVLDGAAIGIRNLLYLLEHGNNLRRIVLNRVLPASMTPLEPTPIRHPTLEVLRLGRSSVIPLLRYLDLPRCATLSVAPDEEATHCLSLSAKEAFFFVRCHSYPHPGPKQLKEFSWTIGTGQFKVEFTRISDGYSLHCVIPVHDCGDDQRTGDLVRAVFKEMGRITADIVLTVHTVVFHMVRGVDRSVFEIFGPMQQVKRINIVGPPSTLYGSTEIAGPASRLYQYMRSRQADCGAMRWMFSMVDTLTVSGESPAPESDLEALLSMVQFRSQPLHATHPPSPFKFISLPEWAQGRKVVEEIRAATKLSRIEYNREQD